MGEMNDTARRVLIEYLMAYLPTDTQDDYSVLKSSGDIRDDLSDMCDISVTEISAEMIKIGYRIVVDDGGRPVWLMSRKQ